MNLLFGENSASFFNKLPKTEKELLNSKIDAMQSVALTEAEVFSNIFPETVSCPNPKCLKFKKVRQDVKRFLQIKENP